MWIAYKREIRNKKRKGSNAGQNCVNNSSTGEKVNGRVLKIIDKREKAKWKKSVSGPEDF
jgi:hypothetical protein